MECKNVRFKSSREITEEEPLEVDVSRRALETIVESGIPTSPPSEVHVQSSSGTSIDRWGVNERHCLAPLTMTVTNLVAK